MTKGRTRNYLIPTIFTLAMLTATPVHAQEKPDILRVFDYFVLSSAAASQCIKPDENALKRFLTNFFIVTTRASDELRKRYPSATSEQIQGAIQNKHSMLTVQAQKMVKAEGCQGKNVQAFIKAFHAHAKWSIPGIKYD